MKLAFSLLLGAVLVGCPRPPPPPEAEPPHRMTWWREARFGMFIHWGLYSTLGGEWEGFDYGKEMEGASAEWIMLAADIPTDDYAALANRFNPTKFDASKWVGIAKDAGMKYFVITSKHHDGFSLFDTELSDYDIIDRSPFKRDVIKELADECARQGIRFGVYYSHSKDWYHRTKRRADPNPPSAKYIEFAQGQVRELLTNYGDIGVLWFDTGGQFKEINGDYGRLVRRLSPRTIIGSRLNADDESLHDFRTMADRSIPEGRVDFDAESPMTMRDNWGYDRDDDNWKSVNELLQRFSLMVCRGANMLLNVGPTPEGELTPEDVERVQAFGRWLRVNGEAVYRTDGSPFGHDFEWGSMTQKPGRPYLHVLKWDARGIRIPGLRSAVSKAYFLADPAQSFEVTHENGEVLVHTSAEAPDENVSVIVLEIEGAIEVDPAATGERHWNIGTGIRLNTEKIAAQRAKGWVPMKLDRP